MAPWEQFEATFQFNRNIAYDKKTVDQILANRRALENQLFIDRLLGLLGVKGVQQAYPPKTNQDLRNLYRQIVSSSFPSHHRQAVIYYLLRDCRAPGDAILQFTRRCYLPEQYEMFIHGLWYLDRLEFRRALDYLTQPSLIPTFPDDILHVLSLQTLPKHDDVLAVTYYLTVSPPLNSEKVRRSFFDILCRASVTESFYFSRKHGDNARREFFEQLVWSVLKSEAGKPRAERALELVGLPLDEEEESWLEDFLLTGKGSTLPGAKDTVLMRRLATGRSQNLPSEVESLSGRKVDGINWDDLRLPGQSTSFLRNVI
ncbi:hypothetical protein VTN49DRAFT_2616 [Thermomyces lanuginosus]|uniref:uncharacterized protein n=1 Tax=Thermomyces lanuginosus TaxID=5541 RepID=UPI00374372C4